MVGAPRVSVIVPFLDAERFLGEAVESVLAQTFDGWELLLVDDGSTDGSTAIARGYAGREPDRIFYRTHPGGLTRGPRAARNLGLAHVRGEYVAFLDADDIWLPGKLHEQTSILDREREAGMVYGLSEWFSWADGGGAAARDFVHELGVPEGELLRPPSLIAPFFAFQTAAIPNPSNILVRRSAAAKVGGFEASFLGPYEDQVFFAKVLLRVPVVAVATVWDRYRRHSGSATGQAELRGEEDALRRDFLTWLIDHLLRSGFADDRVYAALRRQRFLCAHPRLERALRRLRRRRIG